MKNKHSINEQSSITGTFLRQARKKIGFSKEEIAKKLCIKKSIIKDIENDTINSKISTTFLRGYIRSYAKLVHLSERKLMLIINKQSPIEANNKITSIRDISFFKKRKQKKNLIVRFIWILLLGLLFLFWIWF